MPNSGDPQAKQPPTSGSHQHKVQFSLPPKELSKNKQRRQNQRNAIDAANKPPVSQSNQPTQMPVGQPVAPQSSIIKHVPSRAKNIEQILDFAETLQIVNEMLIKVGLRMNANLLFGSNHRSVAMLIVFKSIMDDISQMHLANQQATTSVTGSGGGSSTASVSQSPQSISPDANNPLASVSIQSTTTSSSRSAMGADERPMNQLQNSLKKAMDFLDFCRPLSVSMTNAYKIIKEEILKLDQASTDKAIANLRLDQNSPQEISQESKKSITDSPLDEFEIYAEQKQQLKEFIDRFIDEEIWSAQRGICENIKHNIRTNDVILVYGCSTIVQHVLLDAKSRGKTFRVIVVDSPPHFNGRRMLRFLNDNSISVSYTLINSLSFVMRQATKVLLGANSMLANGYVMSHIGTSQIALMAKATNVPTIFCCETYKLSDRVYVDSFGCNEVDGGHELGSALNLRYDLTPPEFVSMVINERSTVPAESVPALLRFRAEKTKSYVQVVS